VTLNDLERHNSPYFVFSSPNSIALQTDYVTVVEDEPIMSAKYRLPVPFFHFWPKLRHPTVWFLCDSWATCCMIGHRGYTACALSSTLFCFSLACHRCCLNTTTGKRRWLGSRWPTVRHVDCMWRHELYRVYPQPHRHKRRPVSGLPVCIWVMLTPNLQTESLWTQKILASCLGNHLLHDLRGQW